MNTEPPNRDFANPAGAPPPPVLPPPPARTPRGKIGRLPKATRDKLNRMLREGCEQKDVLAKLGDEAKDISPKNISDWHSSPSYQHWELEQEWLENFRDEQESAFDLLEGFDTIKFNQAALQLAVTRLFLALRRLDNPGPSDKPEVAARTLGGLVHALSRASREATNLEKYREACAAAVAAQLKQLNVDRDLSDAEYDLLIKKMDQVFKVPRRQTQSAPKNGSP